MYYVGAFAVILGGCAIVGGFYLWVATEFPEAGKQIAFGGLVAIIFGLGPILIIPAPAHTNPPAAPADVAESTPDPAPPAPHFDIKLRSFTCSEEYGFDEVDGQVQNISDRPLDVVMVFGTFTASNGDTIKTASALIDFQPVMPGQTSPFKVITSGNPLVRRCTVQIGTLFGGTLTVDY